MRTFEFCANNLISNLVVPNQKDFYQVDIFIHTWDEIDHNTISYRNNGSGAETYRTDYKKIQELYNPKKLLIEKQLYIDEKIVKEKLGGFNRSIKGICNNAYTNYKVGELRREYERETSQTYDYVIQTRPDVLFKSPFVVNGFFKFLNEMNFSEKENAFYYGGNFFGRSKIEDDRVIAGTDLIFMAKPKNMDIAMNLFNKFNEYFDEKNFYCMEVFWNRFIKQQGLDLIALDYRFRRDWIVLYKDNIEFYNIFLRKNERVFLLKYIQFLKIKKNDTKIKVYLFGFIPILKISKGSGRIYLFNFIPILKVR